ncbi:MAG: HD domain-containing protein, partial [Candidatus Omnitrophota bacterium]
LSWEEISAVINELSELEIYSKDDLEVILPDVINKVNPQAIISIDSEDGYFSAKLSPKERKPASRVNGFIKDRRRRVKKQESSSTVAGGVSSSGVVSLYNNAVMLIGRGLYEEGFNFLYKLLETLRKDRLVYSQDKELLMAVLVNPQINSLLAQDENLEENRVFISLNKMLWPEKKGGIADDEKALRDWIWGKILDFSFQGGQIIFKETSELSRYSAISKCGHFVLKGVMPACGQVYNKLIKKDTVINYPEFGGMKYEAEFSIKGILKRIFFVDNGYGFEYFPVINNKNLRLNRAFRVHRGHILKSVFKKLEDVITYIYTDSEGGVTLGGGRPLYNGKMPKNLKLWFRITTRPRQKIKIWIRNGLIFKAEFLEASFEDGGRVKELAKMRRIADQEYTTTFINMNSLEFNQIGHDAYQIIDYTISKTYVSIAGRCWARLGLNCAYVDITRIINPDGKKAYPAEFQAKKNGEVIQEKKLYIVYEAKKGTAEDSFEKGGVIDVIDYLTQPKTDSMKTFIITGVKLEEKEGHFFKGGYLGKFRNKRFLGAETEIKYINGNPKYIHFVKNKEGELMKDDSGGPLILAVKTGNPDLIVKDRLMRLYHYRYKPKRALEILQRCKELIWKYYPGKDNNEYWTLSYIAGLLGLYSIKKQFDGRGSYFNKNTGEMESILLKFISRRRKELEIAVTKILIHLRSTLIPRLDAHEDFINMIFKDNLYSISSDIKQFMSKFGVPGITMDLFNAEFGKNYNNINLALRDILKPDLSEKEFMNNLYVVSTSKFLRRNNSGNNSTPTLKILPSPNPEASETKLKPAEYAAKCAFLETFFTPKGFDSRLFRIVVGELSDNHGYISEVVNTQTWENIIPFVLGLLLIKNGDACIYALRLLDMAHEINANITASLLLKHMLSPNIPDIRNNGNKDLYYLSDKGYFLAHLEENRSSWLNNLLLVIESNWVNLDKKAKVDFRQLQGMGYLYKSSSSVTKKSVILPLRNSKGESFWFALEVLFDRNIRIIGTDGKTKVSIGEIVLMMQKMFLMEAGQDRYLSNNQLLKKIKLIGAYYAANYPLAQSKTASIRALLDIISFMPYTFEEFINRSFSKENFCFEVIRRWNMPYSADEYWSKIMKLFKGRRLTQEKVYLKELFIYLKNIHEDFNLINTGYHRFSHSLEVTYLILIFASRLGYDAKSVLEMIVAALLHDFDPRKEYSAPRVLVTVGHLNNSETIRGLVQKMGLDMERIIALILRTDFPFDEQRRDLFEISLDLIKHKITRERFIKQAELLALADQTATYLLLSPIESEERVLELAREMGWDEKNTLSATGEFLKGNEADIRKVLLKLPDRYSKRWAGIKRHFDNFTKSGSPIIKINGVEDVYAGNLQVCGRYLSASPLSEPQRIDTSSIQTLLGTFLYQFNITEDDEILAKKAIVGLMSAGNNIPSCLRIVGKTVKLLKENHSKIPFLMKDIFLLSRLVSAFGEEVIFNPVYCREIKDPIHGVFAVIPSRGYNGNKYQSFAFFPYRRSELFRNGNERDKQHVPGALSYIHFQKLEESIVLTEIQSDLYGGLKTSYRQKIKSQYGGWPHFILKYFEEYMLEIGVDETLVIPSEYQLQEWQQLPEEIAKYIYDQVPQERGYKLAYFNEPLIIGDIFLKKAYIWQTRSASSLSTSAAELPDDSAAIIQVGTAFGINAKENKGVFSLAQELRPIAKAHRMLFSALSILRKYFKAGNDYWSKYYIELLAVAVSEGLIKSANDPHLRIVLEKLKGWNFVRNIINSEKWEHYAKLFDAMLDKKIITSERDRSFKGVQEELKRRNEYFYYARILVGACANGVYNSVAKLTEIQSALGNLSEQGKWADYAAIIISILDRGLIRNETHPVYRNGLNSLKKSGELAFYAELAAKMYEKKMMKIKEAYSILDLILDNLRIQGKWYGYADTIAAMVKLGLLKDKESKRLFGQGLTAVSVKKEFDLAVYLYLVTKMVEAGLIKNEDYPVLKEVLAKHDCDNELESFTGLSMAILDKGITLRQGRGIFDILLVKLLGAKQFELYSRLVLKMHENNLFTVLEAFSLIEDVLNGLHAENKFKEYSEISALMISSKSRFVKEEIVNGFKAQDKTSSLPFGYHLYITALMVDGEENGIEKAAVQAEELFNLIKETNAKAQREEQKIEVSDWICLCGLTNLQAVSLPVANALVRNHCQRGYLPLLQEDFTAISLLSPQEITAIREMIIRMSAKGEQINPSFMAQIVRFANTYAEINLSFDDFSQALVADKKDAIIVELASGIIKRLEIGFGIKVSLDSDADLMSIIGGWNLAYIGAMFSASRAWYGEREAIFKLALRTSLEGKFYAMLYPEECPQVTFSDYSKEERGLIQKIRGYNARFRKEAEKLGVNLDVWLHPEKIDPELTVKGVSVLRNWQAVLEDFINKFASFKEWVVSRNESSINSRLEKALRSMGPWKTALLDNKKFSLGLFSQKSCLTRLSDLQKYIRETLGDAGSDLPEPVADMMNIIHEIEEYNLSSYKKQPKPLRMRFWSRTVGRDSVIANQVGSCTALGSNSYAIFEFLLDLGTIYLVFDEEPDYEERGYVRFFLGVNFAGEAVIFVDSIDGRAVFGSGMAKKFLEKFAAQCGIKPDNVGFKVGLKRKAGGALLSNYFHHSGIDIPGYNPYSSSSSVAYPTYAVGQGYSIRSASSLMIDCEFSAQLALRASELSSKSRFDSISSSSSLKARSYQDPIRYLLEKGIRVVNPKGAPVDLLNTLCELVERLEENFSVSALWGIRIEFILTPSFFNPTK